jgi:hypothetical protein
MNATDVTPDPVIEDRIEQFSDMGFTLKESELLAVARDAEGNYFHVLRVQKMLDNGCTHWSAVRILG